MTPLRPYFVCLDIATAAIDGAAAYLEPAKAPSNYKDPEKIAAYIAEKNAQGADRCGLDPDLGRITCIGHWLAEPDHEPVIYTCPTEADECVALKMLAHYISPAFITFNGLRFDLPFLMRRARYLGIPFPTLNLDRYKTPHVDLSEALSHRGTIETHSLSFYVKRLGWTDLTKPLSGEEESRVPQTGEWEKLEQSVRHDVTATYRLAQWLGVIEPVKAEAIL